MTVTPEIRVFILSVALRQQKALYLKLAKMVVLVQQSCEGLKRTV